RRDAAIHAARTRVRRHVPAGRGAAGAGARGRLRRCAAADPPGHSGLPGRTPQPRPCRQGARASPLLYARRPLQIPHRPAIGRAGTMKPATLLVFLSDNHARGRAGCYGHPVVQTPTLDALAVSGARFANAYTASPICCPARAALATGRYPHQTGYWDNAIVYDGRVPSWGHRLRAAGYATASVGKLHFRATEDDNGFDEEIAPMQSLNGKGGVSMLLPRSDASPVNRAQWHLYLEKSVVGETHYQHYDEQISTQAMAGLEAHAKAERPWALFVSYVSPHPPFTVPQRLWDMYAETEIPLPPAFRPNERP